MTANFTGDEATIRKYLERNIEQELNSERVHIEEVKDCRYIGVRLPKPAKTETIASRTNGTNLALIFGILAGTLMLCFAILMARGRRRRQNMILDDDSPLPVSIPAVIFQKPNQELQRHGGIRASNSGDTEESIPERMDHQHVIIRTSIFKISFRSKMLYFTGFKQKQAAKSLKLKIKTSFVDLLVSALRSHIIH